MGDNKKGIIIKSIICTIFLNLLFVPYYFINLFITMFMAIGSNTLVIRLHLIVILILPFAINYFIIRKKYKDKDIALKTCITGMVILYIVGTVFTVSDSIPQVVMNYLEYQYQSVKDKKESQSTKMELYKNPIIDEIELNSLEGRNSECTKLVVNAEGAYVVYSIKIDDNEYSHYSELEMINEFNSNSENSSDVYEIGKFKLYDTSSYFVVEYGGNYYRYPYGYAFKYDSKKLDNIPLENQSNHLKRYLDENIQYMTHKGSPYSPNGEGYDIPNIEIYVEDNRVKMKQLEEYEELNIDNLTWEIRKDGEVVLSRASYLGDELEINYLISDGEEYEVNLTCFAYRYLPCSNTVKLQWDGEKQLVDKGKVDYMPIENNDELKRIKINLYAENLMRTDSDNDGLRDFTELYLIYFDGEHMELNPNIPDIDNDGLLDGEEVVIDENEIFGDLEKLSSLVGGEYIDYEETLPGVGDIIVVYDGGFNIEKE